MFFDKLFLRVALALFCSMYCASEVQAVLPGEDQTKPKISIKRTSHGSEKEYQQGVLVPSIPPAGQGQDFVNGDRPPEEEYKRASKKQRTTHESSEEDAEFWVAANVAADAAEEEYRRIRPIQASLTPATNPEEDAEFWAAANVAADAAGEEYLRRQQTPTSLTPPASSQGSVTSQQASLVPSPGTQAAYVNPYNFTPEEDEAFLAAAIDAEESYSQGQASQSSSLPIAHGQESLASQTPSFSSPPSESDPDEDSEGHFEGFSYKHLTTLRDHQHYLIAAINSAEKSILITSYTLSADMTGRSDLFKAMQSAGYRGVSIYLYANKIDLGEGQLDALERLRNVMFSEATIHSKLVVVDNKQITCGSYDWLAEPWRGKSRNASLILESSDLNAEVDNIWHVLKKYRTVDFNLDSLPRVKNSLERLAPSKIPFDNPEDSISILNTPYQHGDLFKYCFEQAHRQLTICTPFITGDRRFLQDILPRNMLRSFLNSGRQLNIFYREGDDKIQLLEDHLNQTLSGSYSRLERNVTLTSVKGLHRKTMFADGDLYMEGSYNWLSSARSLKDPYYFMETSILFRGTWAQKLIRKFCNDPSTMVVLKEEIGPLERSFMREEI